MARKRPDIMALTRPNFAEGTRIFTDPAQPEQPLELSLRVTRDGNFEAQITERTQEMLQTYVYGDAEFVRTNGEKGNGPVPLFSPGSSEKMVVPSLQCFRIAQLSAYEEAALRVAKSRGSEEWEPLSFAEWLVIAERMPTAWLEILDWLDTLGQEATKTEKNSLTACGAQPSDSPLSTASVTTPNS